MAVRPGRAPHTRRGFLAATAAGAAACGLPSASPVRAAAASGDRIRLGLIGLGGRGGQHLTALLRRDDCDVVALCDPDAEFLEAAKAKAPRAKACVDMRELLDDKLVDAVVISTCNHWHCLAAVWACAAGKDVYVEKPLSYTLWEGRQLVNASRKYGRVVQVGTQQRSDPLQQQVREFLHDKRALGPIESVVVTRFGVREGIGKRGTPLQPPPTLDYDLWLGPAADAPIYRRKMHYDWHWDWNTGNGESANWGVHVLDDVRNVVFRDAVGIPTAVTCGGGRVLWNDAGETPNLSFAVLETGEVPVVFAMSNLPARPDTKDPLEFEGTQSGYVVHCEGGTYHGRRGGGVALDDAGKVLQEFRGTGGNGEHYADFFDAVRTRRRPAADVVIGHDSSNWSHVINAAWRAARDEGLIPTGNPAGAAAVARLLEAQITAYAGAIPTAAFTVSPRLEVDPAGERFVGADADAANAFLGPRDFRRPYVLEPVAAPAAAS